MPKQDNLLSQVRQTYAGPWPKTVRRITLLIVVSHLVTVLLFDLKLFHLPALMGNLFVVIVVVVLGIYVKHKYPDQQ